MELLTLSRTYPIISIVIGLILFFIGLKFAKRIFWVLAVVAIIVALLMLIL